MSLEQEIKESLVFNYYNKLLQLDKFRFQFKWIAGVLFLLGLIDMLIFDKVHDFLMYLFVLVWTPGLLYIFVTGILHFLVGLKINRLSKKYNISREELLDKI